MLEGTHSFWKKKCRDERDKLHHDWKYDPNNTYSLHTMNLYFCELTKDRRTKKCRESEQEWRSRFSEKVINSKDIRILDIEPYF